MAGNSSPPGTAAQARGNLIDYQKQEVIDAHKRLANLLTPNPLFTAGAGAAAIVGKKSLPQVAKAMIADAAGAFGTRAGAATIPIMYGGYMLYDHAKHYDLNKQNRLASQSFSGRSGMYNPYNDR